MLLFKTEADLPIALAVVATAATGFVVCWILGRMRAFAYLENRQGRYDAIDGLRGYLALMVFVAHVDATHAWKNDGAWNQTDSIIAANLSIVGVGLFFMISGFLFIDRILEHPRMDWARLYNSRLFRIYPLFLLFLALAFPIIFLETGFRLHVPPGQLFGDLLGWFFFGSNGMNGMADARYVTAGVQWTLRYEWLFYLSLPLIAWFIRRGPWGVAILVGGIVAAYATSTTVAGFDTRYLLLFAHGGLASAARRRLPDVSSWINHPALSIVSLAAFALSMLSFPFLGWQQLALMALFFLLCVLGNSVFGLLTRRSSRLLGELSYGIYLLHGIVLFVIFTMALPPRAILMPVGEFLPITPILTILVLLVVTPVFLLIEHPAIKLGRRYNVLSWVRRKFR